MPAEINFTYIFIISFFSLLITFFATIFPSISAAKLDPIEALNMSKRNNKTFRNISKKYEGKAKKISVLNEINLIINKGELVSLTGPSGSGKSTLLHIIALLDQPSSGEVFFKKKSFTKSSEYEEKDLVRKKVFQLFINKIIY